MAFSIPWLETVSKRERQRREEKAQKLMFPFGDEQTGRAAGTYPDEGAGRGSIVPAVPSEGLSAAYAGRNARRTAGAAGRMADKPAGPQL